MTIRVGLRNIVGYLLAGALLAGCFVPIAYGVYKIYEGDEFIKITLNVKEPPEVAWAKTVKTIEERKVSTIEKRDDKSMTLVGKFRNELPATLTVTPLRGEKTSTLTLTVKKGKHPEQEKTDLVDFILKNCKEMGLTCTKE